MIVGPGKNKLFVSLGEEFGGDQPVAEGALHLNKPAMKGIGGVVYNACQRVSPPCPLCHGPQ